MSEQTMPVAPSPGALGDLKAWTWFRPALYCMGQGTHCPPCQAGKVADHGRGSVAMWWYVGGEDLVVQFMAYTGWYHPADPLDFDTRLGTMAADLGYHSARPLYDGGDWMGRDDCHILEGGECYYDGSGLNAEAGWDLLRSEGHEAVWAWLLDYWHQTYDRRAAYERGETE